LLSSGLGAARIISTTHPDDNDYENSLNRSRDFEKSSTFINGILRHWALLALYPQSYIKKKATFGHGIASNEAAHENAQKTAHNFHHGSERLNTQTN
jgi:hypothetical protein